MLMALLQLIEIRPWLGIVLYCETGALVDLDTYALRDR